MTKRTVIAICAAFLVAAYFVSNTGFNPLDPLRPANDRPFVRFLARVAKIGLWVAVFAEPSNQEPRVQYKDYRNRDEAMICHREGW